MNRLEIYNKQTNLRDFKKEKTANQLAEAAFELALERGLDDFVVNDIVQRAGYSRRTFANYYSCKEEAVVAIVFILNEPPQLQKLLASIENATPIDILYHVMKMQFTADLLKKVSQLVSLSKTHTTLEPYILSVLQHFQAEAVKAVRQFSDGRYSENYPYFLAGAVYGSLLPLVDGSLNIKFPGQGADESSEDISFNQYLDIAFNYLRNGFNQ